MKALLKIELHKAIGNKWFYVSLGIGCCLAVASALGCLQIDLRDKPSLLSDSHYFPPSVLSVYSYWIVVDGSQPTTDLFFLLVPLLAAIPYSWSFLSEERSGYASQIIARTGRLEYYCSKLFAVFVSGGLAITIPVVLNFLFCMTFAPFLIPDVGGVVSFGIFEASLWSNIFYNNPGLYCLLRVLLLFVFSGLWASFIMCLSGIFKRSVALILVPYLFLIFLKALNEYIFTPLLAFYEDLTPFGYLRGVAASGILTSWWVIALELSILSGFIILVLLSNRKRDIV